MKKIHWGSLALGIAAVLIVQYFLSKRRTTA